MLGKLAFTNKIVAKNLGVNEDRVAKVMDFFTQDLNRELVACEHPFIYVRGLGTFTLALGPINSKLRRSIWQYKKVRRGEARKNEENSVALQELITELFRIRRLLKTRKKEIQQLRHERKVNDDING